MGIDNPLENELTMDPVLLELAAHPLNSINPPPKDLPNVLDSLLASESQIQQRIILCRKKGKRLNEQVNFLCNRLAALNNAFPQFYSKFLQTSTHPDLTDSDDNYMKFRASSLLVRRMRQQLAFMGSKFNDEFAPTLEQLATAHHHVLNEFLGEQHDHARLRHANAATKTCVVGCGWYVKHGPSEWTKQPYTNRWWKEMNNTDWDWIRVREHIENMVLEGQKTGLNINLFDKNVTEFVPAWMWYNDTRLWRVKASIERPGSDDRQSKNEVKVQVEFIKSDEMKSKEKVFLEQQQRQRWVQEGMHAVDASTRPLEVVVETVGIQDMDQKLIFDKPALAPDWRSSGQHSMFDSWLNSWGFQTWLRSKAEKNVAVSKVKPSNEAGSPSGSQHRELGQETSCTTSITMETDEAGDVSVHQS